MAAIPPYTPEEIKNLIPAANSSWCSKLLGAVGRLFVTIYNLYKWAVNSDGTATDDFKAWVGVASTGTAGVPTNVAASDGTSATQVVVGWTAVAGATSYSIYRSTGSDSSLATLIGTSTTPSHTDTTVTVDVVYNYWVRATTTAGTSDFSTPDSGYAQSAGNTFSSQVNYNFVVPLGIVSLGVKVWGPGGAGGAYGSSPFGLPGTPTAPGGGGGGGEYAAATITVTPGETLNIFINSSGASLKRSTTVLVSCVGGGVGGNGTFEAGAGGAGGTGGTTDAGETARANGINGSPGSGSAGGAGGESGLAETGAGTGGVGQSLDGSGHAAGLLGKVTLTW